VRDKDRIDKLNIRNLVKKYGYKKAVNNLSLTVFKNEILVLLGHNGAGKTTTISMLTGLEKATQGEASLTIDGRDINLLQDDADITDFISVCPQVNILCEKMTVQENIKFFCKFKDVKNEDDEIERNLELFNLAAKADTLACNLSGGQKRKLQLCITLLGDA
jgi:ATP-binding cassette subfamily A (ABC1) protein 3